MKYFRSAMSMQLKEVDGYLLSMHRTIADHLTKIYGYRKSQNQNKWKTEVAGYLKEINDITVKPDFKKLKDRQYMNVLYSYSWQPASAEDIKSYYKTNGITDEKLTIKSDQDYQKFIDNIKLFAIEMSEIFRKTPPFHLDPETIYQKIDEYFLS